MAKQCKKCSGAQFSKLSGSDEKICLDCGEVMKWPLHKGQKSLLIKGKVGTKERKV